MELCIPKKAMEMLSSYHQKQAAKPWMDACALFLNYVEDFADVQGFVSLNSRNVQQLVSQSLYKQVRDVWIELKFGYRAQKAAVGKSAAVFRVRYQNVGDSFMIYDLQTIAGRRRHTKALKERTPRYPESRPEALRQREFLASTRISFDMELAASISEKSGPGWRCLPKIHKLQNPEWRSRMSTDKYGCRIYHPLGFLPKVCRQCVLLDGERMVEVDVSHCSLLLLSQRMQADAVFDARFSNDAREAAMYERIATQAGITRECAKGRIQRVINTSEDRDEDKDTADVRGFMRFNYPVAMRWIEDRIGASGMYEYYAKQESAINLRIVQNVLNAGGPAIILHDAILTSPSWVLRVSEQMQKEFQGLVRIKETFRNSPELAASAVDKLASVG